MYYYIDIPFIPLSMFASKNHSFDATFNQEDKCDHEMTRDIKMEQMREMSLKINLLRQELKQVEQDCRQEIAQLGHKMSLAHGNIKVLKDEKTLLGFSLQQMKEKESRLEDEMKALKIELEVVGKRLQDTQRELKMANHRHALEQQEWIKLKDDLLVS